jgi:hypothetical protein
MVWIRYGKIRAIWKCTTARGYETKYHAVGVSIRDEYEKKPEEVIQNWASRLGDFVARRMCSNACGSLSTSVFCDEGSVQSEIVYTSEMLIVKPGIKEKEEIIVPPKVKIPADVLASIEVILREMKENIDNVDYIYELKRELDKILIGNKLSRRDIEDMIRKDKLEQIIL